ncbi:MAG: hypothetical protein FK734_12330 [Asgard group archaeon]|nr:hypothetical protein [Asgard group archaeon]
MISSTFDELVEIASKKYDSDARKTLEKQLQYYLREYPTETIKQLGLPQVLMFFSSCVARANEHKIIQTSDVEIAFSLLRYVISRDYNGPLLINNSINIGLSQTEQLKGRLNDLLRVKGDMKTKNNLDNKMDRLVIFLKEGKLHDKHLNRLIIEMRASILLISRSLAFGSLDNRMKVNNDDIDTSYDIVRNLIFKFDILKVKILHELYSIDNPNIWNKIPKMTYDQTAHDHLSSTAYAVWENELPEAFESLKKHINCGARPFIAAIFGFGAIYGAKKGINRVGTEELDYILEDFEKLVFRKINPLIIDEEGVNIDFTKDGLDLMSYVSRWITTVIITHFGKDEFVLNYSSIISRQMSLLLFMSMVESIRTKNKKIDVIHIAKAISVWSEELKLLPMIKNPDL